MEFAKQCRIAGVNIREAVIWSCDFYDDKVCRKIFKRPFPPLNVVIGKKSIERLSLFKKGTKKEKVTKSLVNLYWNAIACLDKKEAIALIDGGWLSDHKELAKKLRNRLVKTGSN